MVGLAVVTIAHNQVATPQTANQKVAADMAAGTRDGNNAGMSDKQAGKRIPAITVSNTRSQSYVDAFNNAYSKANPAPAKEGLAAVGATRSRS